jgi:1-acyl-sn-glycerol-3-phosphate acyltransferase
MNIELWSQKTRNHKTHPTLTTTTTTTTTTMTTASTSLNASKATDDAPAYYYKLDVGSLPDELFHPRIPVSQWLSSVQTVGKAKGFPANTLNQLKPIPRMVEIERIIGNSLYVVANILPFLLPALGVLYFVVPNVAQSIALFVFVYVTTFAVVEEFYFKPYFLKLYQRPNSTLSSENIQENQHAYTERNASKYHSIQFVWPKTLQRPAMESTPMIFCAVPHGVVPIGITTYPIWSKLFNDKICHWTVAPVVLNIPVVNSLLLKMGYIPAKAKDIEETLTKKEHNVGVVLDGIAGMFHSGAATQETAYLKQRKGIVKVALRAGVPLVPVYAFGHSELYTVVVDPLGLLKRLSLALDTALVPYFGRFGWFLGPPYRIPITMCCGEPVLCPRTAEPTKEQINEYHQKLLDSYQELFDQHKAAYGWGGKVLKFV